MAGLLIFQAQKRIVFAQVKFHTHCVQSQTLHIPQSTTSQDRFLRNFLEALCFFSVLFYVVPQEISQTSWLGYFSYYYKSTKLPILLHVTIT